MPERLASKPGWRTPSLAPAIHLPATASGGVRIDAGGDLWIELRSADVRDAVGQATGESVVYPNIEGQVDAVHVVTAERAEELRVYRTRRPRVTARWRVMKGAAVGELRSSHGLIEVTDRSGSVRLTTEPGFATDSAGRRADVELSLEGDSLVATSDTHELAAPFVLDPSWKLASTQLAEHRPAYAFPISGGRVFLTGVPQSGTTHQDEIYDSATDAWFAGGTASAAHGGSAAVVQFADGKILAAGGSGATRTSFSELYDPGTNTWAPVPSLPTARSFMGSVRLDATHALVVGGNDGSTNLKEALRFDETTKTWATLPPMANARYAPGVVLLASGRVLVVGGDTSSLSTEIYNPSTNTWAAAAPVPEKLGYADAVLLADKRVLMVTDGGGTTVGTGYLYDETANTWKKTAAFDPGYSPSAFILSHPLALLPSGRVFHVGNTGGSCANKASIYDPVADAWRAAPPHPSSDTVCELHIASLPGGALLVPSRSQSAIFTEGSADGTACTAAADCASGNCVDGVCCNTACTLQCQSCNIAGKVGTCSLATGAPTGGRTACAGSGPCAGSCDGTSTFCTYPPSTTACSTVGCTGGSATSAGNCNGAGTCGAAAPVSCGAYACGAVACKTSCTTDADCAAGAFCNKGTGACVLGPKPNGSTCAVATECSSGICASGTCCDKACDGECQSCGTGSCQAKSITTTCGSISCTGASIITSHCSGTDGTCVPNATGTACANGLKCADATTCKSSCSSDADCATGSCNTTAGTCASGVVDGGTDTGPVEIADAADASGFVESPTVTVSFQRCAKDAECPTHHCVDGVCCNTACTDKCSSCALPSTPGICTVEPAGVDLRSECGVSGTCTSTCGGDGKCVGAGPGTVCALNRCVGASRGVGAATCTAAGGSCQVEATIPFDCAPYVCEPAFGACRTSCNSTEDCAAGNVCDVASGKCVAPAPPEDSSGCVWAHGRAASHGGGWASALLLVLAARRRRKSIGRDGRAVRTPRSS